MSETDPRPSRSDGPGGDLDEALDAVLRRLDEIEALVVDRLRPDEALVGTVQSALTSFNTRLGRLEEAFVKAVEDSGSGAEDVLDQIRRAVHQALAEAPVRSGDGLGTPPGEADPPDGVTAAPPDLATGLQELSARVEAVASMLEGHVRDTEASLGRRATEVTRRLASDFGLRPRRS